MSNPRHNIRDVRAPRGPELNAKSWMTEAPLRMLMNNSTLMSRAAARVGRLRRHWPGGAHLG